MKKKLYVVIPIIVAIIITHALFGHLIFGFPYEQDINKYSTDVHLQPEWNRVGGLLGGYLKSLALSFIKSYHFLHCSYLYFFALF